MTSHSGGFRVLHASKVYRPDVAGGTPEIIRLLVRLDRPSEIIVARLHGVGRTDAIEGIPVRRATTLGYLWSMPLAPFYPLLLWRRMRWADLVDYHFPFPLADLTLALWLPKRVALVVHWHSEIVAQRTMLPYLGWLFRRTLRRADRIIVSSQALIDHSPFLRAVAEKCVVVPFGVETNYWSELDDAERRRVEELRQQYPRLVLAVGRLVPYKGFAALINAMTKVDGRLVIVGAGYLLERLTAEAEALGIRDRVVLTGFVERSELKCLLHACELFVLPSVTPNEAFGMVQLEAMAVGKPVINTRLPTGVPWVARDGQEALTVTPGSTDELAAAISRLLDDPALARSLGERGRARVAEDFTLQRFFEQTEAVYSSALAARQHARSAVPKQWRDRA
jgi:glycosyltransferase involved in cell wall biosynthesis